MAQITPTARERERIRVHNQLERDLAEADGIIRELEATERRQRREREQERIHIRNPRLVSMINQAAMMQNAARINSLTPPPGYPERPRHQTAPNPTPEPEPITELSYQISALTTELRNTRDTMAGLSETMFNKIKFSRFITAIHCSNLR